MKISSAGFGLFSGAGFCFPPKELLGGHAPVNSNIVVIVLPDLNPVNQLSNYQMLGFIAGIVKAAGPAQDLVHLDFVGLLVVLLHFQQDFGFFLLLRGGIQPGFLLQEHGIDNA